MKKVEEKAYAKINLVLNIGDLRPDGYHDIQTIMQSLELHDDVTVEQTGGTGITVTASVDTIPTDESNLAVKAVKAFAAKTGSAQVGSADKEADAVFTLFAPYDDPEIVISIVVEGGASGGNLAQAAGEIVNYYFSAEHTVESVDAENTLLR